MHGGASVKHRIAAIPGDGIGKEVVPEGMRVLDAAGRRFGFEIEWTTFDWSCERYAQTGRMMPETNRPLTGKNNRQRFSPSHSRRTFSAEYSRQTRNSMGTPLYEHRSIFEATAENEIKG